MNKKFKKQLMRNKLLLMIPILIIGGIFLVNMLGAQFLTDGPTFGEGRSTLSQTFTPSSDVVTTGSTASVTIKYSYSLSLEDGEYTGEVTGIKIILNGETILDTSYVGKSSFTHSIPKTLSKGAYTAEVILTTTGDLDGALGGKYYFDVTGAPPTLRLINPVDDGTITVSTSVTKGDVVIIPISFSVTNGGSPITEIITSFSGNNEYAWEGSGEGTIQAEPGMLITTAAGDDVATQFQLNIWVYADDGAITKETLNVNIIFSEIASASGDGDDDLLAPGFELPLTIIMVAFVVKWRKRDE